MSGITRSTFIVPGLFDGDFQSTLTGEILIIDEYLVPNLQNIIVSIVPE